MYFLLSENGQIHSVQEKEIPKFVEKLPQREDIHGTGTKRWKQKLLITVQCPYHAKEESRAVPLLGQGHSFLKFAIAIEDTGVWFADYDGVIEEIVTGDKEELAGRSPAKVLYRILCNLIEKDSQIIDKIYKQLASLEGDIPRDNARFFLQKMDTMKHSVYQMFRFYHQLTELSEDLMEWECALLDKEEMQIFERFSTKTERLSDDMEMLREYAMEIWEIYQSQISIRQNDIMKVLTIVTTVFLPLSLVAGWYGMNFAYMPELSWKYGYAFVIALAVVIVSLSLYIFRKKKFW